MRIFIIDRDLEEIKGIEWYLKNYVTSTGTINYATNSQQLELQLSQFNPQVIFIETELVTAHVEQLLRTANIPIIAMTAEPTFQQAMKAISLKAAQLFVKPIPLEQLKSALVALPKAEKQLLNKDSPEHSDAELYLQLFLNAPQLVDKQQFFIIEPANYRQNLDLYHWLITSPVFESLTVLPLQNRILGLLPIETAHVKLLRFIIQEWHKFNEAQINIALYDGEHAPLQHMYQACKYTLAQRFYKGYGHLFVTSETIAITRLDPLLSPEQQQLWITSLENGDLKAIRAFLHQLTSPATFYHADDVRIHLTSVLAQIRRFMLKYHLQQQSKIEQQYRALFHHILEHPILYAIVQEFILFTQMLIESMKKTQQQTSADYTELAIAIIEERYSHSELTLQIVAKQLNISANYLSNVFSKKRGIPFKKFLQQYRMQQAAKILLDTNHSIAIVADLVGIIDSNYFIKTFRDYYHTTPHRYRLHFRKTKG